MREVYINNSHSRLTFSNTKLEKIIELLDSISEIQILAGELSIAFLEKPAIIDLHKNFFNDPTPTDVMTFTGDPEMEFAGEICVSPDQAWEVHTEQGTTFPYELTLYIVHGWLHLAGYNDKKPEDTEKMREMETITMNQIIDRVGLPDFAFLDTI